MRRNIACGEALALELGVMVTIREGTDFADAFASARDAGFSRGQVTIKVHGITAEEMRQIAVAARHADFHVDAVGCYINPLRLDDNSLTQADRTDWLTVVNNMSMMNGVERIVCWSGTLSRMLGAPNLLNGEPDTFNNVFITLHGLLEQVRGLPVQVVLEPYTAHVLCDSRTCVRMAQKFPGGEVKVVLDAPNVIAASDFAARDQRVQEFVTQTAASIGLIHLKDMDRNAEGHRVFLPAGQGALNYGAYLRAIAQYVPEVPVVLDNADTIEESIAAREFVETQMREYGL